MTRKKKSKPAFKLSTTIDAKAPRGENAVLVLDKSTEVAMHRERAMEGIKKMIDSLQTGGDFPPILICKVNGEVKATTCEVKDGVYILPELKAPSKLNLFRKKVLVQRIVKKLHPVLRRDIAGVVSVALLRKSNDQLKEIEAKLKQHKEAGLRNRIGCIFLEVGDESVQI